MDRKRTIAIIIFPLALALLCLGAYRGWMAWQDHIFLTEPPQAAGEKVVFRVDKGELLSTIARNLHEQGLITDTKRFLNLAREQSKASSARAGKFLLSTGWLPGKILDVITTTPGILKRVSIPEGLHWWDIAERLEQAGMGSAEELKTAIHDRTLLEKYGIQADSAEGYLYPETYMLSAPDTGRARYMVETMIKQFFTAAKKAWPEGLPEWKELNHVVTLASIVEKETGAAVERPRIAGVFTNRLKRGMLLQTDPSTIYGLGPEFDGNLTRAHLKSKKNPYNTYTHPGLPPGPICSPGLEAIRAVLHPEKHKYLYFVAKGDGTHHFSPTLKEHNRAVRKYQIRRNRKTYRSTAQ